MAKSFYKLKVKKAIKIVADGIGLMEHLMSLNVGRHLSAKEFNEAMLKFRMICCGTWRKSFESEIVHLKNAICSL